MLIYRFSCYKNCIVFQKFDPGAIQILLRVTFWPWSFTSVFLNRRDTSRYRDLKTFSPGLGTLEKLKIYQKLQRNQVFLRIKSLEKSITGTSGHKTISYRDKRQKKYHCTGT
jgi:hypothetical protein